MCDSVTVTVWFWRLCGVLKRPLWWKSVLENGVLGPQKAKNLPAAQPWWAAGCAVTRVGGQGEKMLYTKMGSGGVWRGPEGGLGQKQLGTTR